MSRELFVNSEPAGRSEAADPAHQDLHPGLEGGRRRSAFWVSIHQRVDRGVGESELDGEIPARAQVLDRILRIFVDVLGGEEGHVAVLSDRLQEAVLVAEQAVDRRSSHPSRGRDCASGDRVATLAREQVSCGLDNPLPGQLAPAAARGLRFGGRSDIGPRTCSH
jgi:hypothetical protein